MRPFVTLFLVFLLGSGVTGAELELIRVSADGKGFVLAESNRPFIAWGFNYDHAPEGTLIEDYWDNQWDDVEKAFREMKRLGANVVRIHLQFAKFMTSPEEVNSHSLGQLKRLVRLAEETGIYLDITGLGCYLKKDVPEWYDELDEQGRWQAQARFWEAIAEACASSPAIFCYDLMNEPASPAGKRNEKDWLGPPFAGMHFVQMIALDQNGRDRSEIAREWIRTLVSAIRKHDQKHLITVGLVPWSLDRPGLTSGFVPEKIAEHLDFIAVHIYPEADQPDDAMETLKGFAVAGKPVIIEEIFPLKCGPEQLETFILESRKYSSGWIGFYWGKSPEDLRNGKTLGEMVTLAWLEMFQKLTPEILGITSSNTN